jgi:ABC-2 type transport system permease protein
VLIGMVLALAIGGVAAGLGLRTGSQEAVQGIFPLAFIGLFISSAFFPTTQMSGLYRTIAEANPLTWMIDGARNLVVLGFSWSDLGTSLAVGAVLAALSLRFALRQLAWRVAGAA